MERQTEPVPIVHVHPVEVKHIIERIRPEVEGPKPPIWDVREPEVEPETIRETIPEQEQKQFPEQFGNNSPKNSESELLEPPEPAPQGGLAPYKKKGQVGRKRKYEEPGNNGEIPVKEVVLFRHIKGRQWPKMSQDMQEWYEFYYFSKPKRTERAKDAEDYNRHVKSWERGQGWVAEYEASQGRPYQSQAVGHSGKIVAYRKRATN